MVNSLHFGRDCSVALDLAEGSLVAENTSIDVQSIDDPVSAIRAALSDPVDFPALDRMVLSDDMVAIALQPGLACAPQLVAGTIQSLMEAGVPPELLRVVRTHDDRAISDKRLMDHVAEAVRDRIELVRHDPTDRKHLSFLGASKDGRAVYANRVLCDAAVVIPIGSHRNHAGCVGIHQSWFPCFADAETQERFTRLVASMSESKLSKCQAECEEAAWMLGVQLVVQSIPAGNDGVLQILAGSPHAVWQKGNELSVGAWRLSLNRRASLVVAAIGGGPEQQTWDNVVHTIDTALQAVESDGAIAVCSQLKTKPGPALRRLAGAEDFEAAGRAILKKPTSDALAASRLNRALQRVRIYLLSDLDENDVEDLGVAFVSEASEIARLTARHDSCLVLQNAQHVSLELKAEN